MGFTVSERQFSAPPLQCLIFSFSASSKCSTSCAHSQHVQGGNKKMRTFRPLSGFTKSGFWICDRCLRGQPNFPHLYTTYATKVTLRPGSNTLIPELLRTKRISAQHPTSRTLTSNNHSGYREVSENNKANRRNLAIILVTLLGAGTILAFSDSVKHSYAAATRSLRVLIALSQSVREYVFRESLSVACG